MRFHRNPLITLAHFELHLMAPIPRRICNLESATKIILIGLIKYLGYMYRVDKLN